MKSFLFDLNDKVCLKTNPNESGRVIGRAEYAEADNSYLIRYKAADGRSGRRQRKGRGRGIKKPAFLGW